LPGQPPAGPSARGTARCVPRRSRQPWLASHWSNASSKWSLVYIQWAA
jgi:hypothetical protein